MLDCIKIAHFGNLANDAYPIVKNLRDRQIEADLFIYYPAHVSTFPQWELCDVDINEIGDPFKPNLNILNKNFDPPHWMNILYFNNTLEKIWKIIRSMRKYDLVIAHIPFSIYGQFSGKPYIAFDAGAIRYFDSNSFKTKLHIRGYKKSKKIIATNPDTLDLFDKYDFQPIFVPFLIETSRYKPKKLNTGLPAEYVFFMPSRQYWKEKGNNLLVEAFADFQKDYKDSILVMIDWGKDAERTKSLVNKCGIEKSVRWLSLMSKPKLIEWYNSSTAVCDQFVLGSYGTTAPEAMACGKPVIIYLSEKHHLKTFGEMPPVLNARTKDEINHFLNLCTDSNFVKRMGETSRRWIEKYHSPEVVVERHISIYKTVDEL